MAIFKTIKVKNADTGIEEDVKVKVSAREQKATIMKVNKWTDKEYKRRYDIFKNKLRAYEAFRKSKGINEKKQSASELLYLTAQSKVKAKKWGYKYRPSITMKRINAMPSISSGKAGQKALTGKLYMARREEYYKKGLERKFKEFIKNMPLAKEMKEKIKDPVKLEEALIAYADKIHAYQDEQEKIQASSAIPYGENSGSPDDIDFDYSEYL